MMNKILPLFAMCLFLGSPLFAQNDNIDAAKDNISIYPVEAEAKSDKEVAFIALFDKDVALGNLHVYATQTQEQNYYFEGSEITPGFYDMLPDRLRKRLRGNTGSKAYAVQAIRGEGEEYYILRMPGEKGGQAFALYDLENGHLMLKTDLAFRHCVDGTCYQQDAWITDLDGDVRLDVVKKYAEIGEMGTVGKEYTKVFLQRPAGVFVETDEIEIDPITYPMNQVDKG